MAWPIVLWPALAASLALITFLVLDKAQRDAVLRRLGLARQPVRASTPSLEKQPLPPSSPSSSSKPLASSASELASTFPPSQRHRLATVAAGLPAAQRAHLLMLSSSSSPQQFDHQAAAFQQQSQQLGLDEDYRRASPAKHTPTGFSVREVRALGDFPDYAALAEVPAPRAYDGFDLERARPRPYRPFRWAYHQTMSLTRMETDWWIELESTYRERIAQRELYRQHGAAVLQWLPGSELACKELMEMVVQFVCARYPRHFALVFSSSFSSSSSSGDHDNANDGDAAAAAADLAPPVRLENRILGTSTPLRGEVHPLRVLLDNVPEDFAITLRDPQTGYYSFRAGIVLWDAYTQLERVICSALGWNVASKIGLKLHEIHEPIPDYKEKMQFSMDRFFSKMPTSKPIQRGSWGLEVDQPLYMPPGDPRSATRATVQDPALLLPDPDSNSRLHLRVDWQTLRRLPLSGAVVFNFKALFTPLSSLRSEPRVPALLLRVLRGGKPELMAYKGTWHVEHAAVPLLERLAGEQEAKGLVEPGWEPRTLDESPWFPGWEDKWHAEQGF
ncbi:alpha-1,2-mannosyltransferase [Xylariaceae sp. FL0804]|nr:alpha-1,2-mannosyltransferase [Xylariaceae sp. FL0804]